MCLAASAAATYLRTVLDARARRDHRLRTVFGRPACPRCNTSTTLTTWNCLLGIRPALASKYDLEQVPTRAADSTPAPPRKRAPRPP